MTTVDAVVGESRVDPRVDAGASSVAADDGWRARLAAATEAYAERREARRFVRAELAAARAVGLRRRHADRLARASRRAV